MPTGPFNGLGRWLGSASSSYRGYLAEFHLALVDQKQLCHGIGKRCYHTSTVVQPAARAAYHYMDIHMDETTKGIIERIAIRFPKPTRIPSGQVCSVFYDCYQLTPNDLARLSAFAVGHLDHDAFDVAVGVAYSGILFAASVAGGRKVAILQGKNGTTSGLLNAR